jgi:transposase
MTCRYYGISRQGFYTWYRRYETEGLAGLRDRSTRPAHCPHETPAEVVAKVESMQARPSVSMRRCALARR